MMKSRLDQYLEAAQMSPEDAREINRLSARIHELKMSGDDQFTRDDIREAQQEIKRIRNRYLSPEEKLHAMEASRKRSLQGWKQRHEANIGKGKSVASKFEQMSDEEKAIEAIVNIKNRTYMNRRERQAIIDDIKNAFNIMTATSNIRSQLSLKDKAEIGRAHV
jgi:hypothetical protein